MCERHADGLSFGVGLDDDCGPDGPGTLPPDPGPALPQLELRQRYRDGYDDEGNAVFTWETLYTGSATLYETRTEFDAEAGATRVVGQIMIANPGTVTETLESCMLAETETGLWWRITAGEVFPDRLVLKTERTDGGR